MTNRKPILGEAHERLRAFVGNWQVEGKSYADGSTVEWLGEESYEFLEGDYFLVGHFHAKVGKDAFNGMMVIGYDEGRDEYFSTQYDNSGFSPSYQVFADGDRWTYKGSRQKAVIRFEEQGHAMLIHWDWKPKEDAEWTPLCDLRATKMHSSLIPAIDPLVSIEVR